MRTTAPTVLAVVNTFPSPSETFILRKLQGLRRAGYDVQVVAGHFTRDAPTEGFRLVPLVPWREKESTLRALTTRAGRNLLRGEGRSFRSAHRSATPWRRAVLLAPLAAPAADIVHFEFSGIAVGYRDLLEKLRPAKLAVSCRGSAEQIHPLADRTRAGDLHEVFDRVDLIHCVSDDIRATVEDLGAPPEKIVVNRPAVPVAEFAPLSDLRAAHDGPLRVLSIGRLHWKKGFDDALRAMALLAADGHEVEYRVAGEGPERQKLAFLCSLTDLQDRFTMLGAQTQQQIKEQLRWADVLLLPSLSEGISNAVLEAMASGLPVISTDCGGMTEVITSDEDGIIVPVGDTEAMAHHLAVLASDPDQRARLGACAAERAAAEFDLERQIRVFTDAYSTLLGHRP